MGCCAVLGGVDILHKIILECHITCETKRHRAYARLQKFWVVTGMFLGTTVFDYLNSCCF